MDSAVTILLNKVYPKTVVEKENCKIKRHLKYAHGRSMLSYNASLLLSSVKMI
jgi:hypothetical protein